MTDIKEIRGRGPRRLLKLVLLLVSTATIMAVSALTYADAVFQKALNVGGNGGTTGSVSATSSSIGPALVILVVQAFVVGLCVLGFPPKLPHRASETVPLRVTQTTPTQFKPRAVERSIETSGKNDAPTKNQDMLTDILESLRKNSVANE